MSVPTINDTPQAYTFPETPPSGKSQTFVRIEKLEVNNTKNVYIPPTNPVADIINATAHLVASVATMISTFVFAQHHFSVSSAASIVQSALRAIIQTTT